MQSETPHPGSLVLGFDTSAAHCAAALVSGGRLLTQHIEAMPTGQAERLLPLLEEMLAAQGLGWAGLTALGVGVGPGNFTGVRIAVAAARGLALALGIPAVGVSTLDARAFGLPRPLAVVEQARRGQVYASRDGAAPQLLALEGLAAALGPLPLAGSAAAEAAAVTGGPVLAPAMPLAEAIARLAAARAGTPQLRPAPLYLRAPDAAPPSEAPPAILTP